MPTNAHSSTSTSRPSASTTDAGRRSRSTDALGLIAEPSRNDLSSSSSFTHSQWPIQSARAASPTSSSWATRVRGVRKAFRSGTNNDDRLAASKFARKSGLDDGQYIYQSRARDQALQSQRSRVSEDTYDRDPSLPRAHSRTTLSTFGASNHAQSSSAGGFGLSRFFSLRKRTQSSSEYASSAVASTSRAARDSSPLAAGSGRPSSRRSQSIASPQLQSTNLVSSAYTSTPSHAGAEGAFRASQHHTPASSFSFPARPSVDSTRPPTLQGQQGRGAVGHHASSRSVPLTMAELLGNDEQQSLQTNNKRESSGPSRTRSITRRLTAYLGSGGAVHHDESSRDSRQRRVVVNKSAISPRSHHLSLTNTALPSQHMGTTSTRRSHARTMTSPASGSVHLIPDSIASRRGSALLADAHQNGLRSGVMASTMSTSPIESPGSRPAAPPTRKLSLSRLGLGRWRDSDAKKAAAAPRTPEIESWKRPSAAARRNAGTPEPDMAEWSPEELNAEVFGLGKSIHERLQYGQDDYFPPDSPTTENYFGASRSESELSSHHLQVCGTEPNSPPRSLEHRLATPSLLGNSPLLGPHDSRRPSLAHRLGTPSLLGNSPLLAADDIMNASRLSVNPSISNGLGLHDETAQSDLADQALAQRNGSANSLPGEGSASVSLVLPEAPATPKRKRQSYVEGLGLVMDESPANVTTFPRRSGEAARHARSQSSASAMSAFRPQSTESSTSWSGAGPLSSKRPPSYSSESQRVLSRAESYPATDDTPILRLRKMVVNTNEESGDDDAAQNLFFRPVGKTSQSNMQSPVRRFHWRKLSRSSANAPLTSQNELEANGGSDSTVHDERGFRDVAEGGPTLPLLNGADGEQEKAPHPLEDNHQNDSSPAKHKHSRSQSSGTPLEAALADVSVLDPHQDMVTHMEHPHDTIAESITGPRLSKESSASLQSEEGTRQSPVDGLGPLPADDEENNAYMPRRSSNSNFVPSHRRNATATSVTTTGSSVPPSMHRGSMQMSEAHTIGTSYSGNEAMSALDAEVGHASRTQLEIIHLAQGRAKEWARKEASERAVAEAELLRAGSPRWSPPPTTVSMENSDLESGDKGLHSPPHMEEVTPAPSSPVDSLSNSILSESSPTKRNVRRARSQPMSAFRPNNKRVPLAPSQRRAASRTSEVESASTSDADGAPALFRAPVASANTRGPALRPSHSGSLLAKARQDAMRENIDIGGPDGRRAPTPSRHRTSRIRSANHRIAPPDESELDGVSTSASQWPTSPSDSPRAGLVSMGNIDAALARSPVGWTANGHAFTTPRKSSSRGTPRSGRNASGGSASRVPTYATSEEASLAKRREQADRERRAREKEAEAERRREERYALRKKSDPLLARRLALMGLSEPDSHAPMGLDAARADPASSNDFSTFGRSDGKASIDVFDDGPGDLTPRALQMQADELQRRVGRRRGKSISALLDLPPLVQLDDSDAAREEPLGQPMTPTPILTREDASDRSLTPDGSMDAPTVAPNKSAFIAPPSSLLPHLSLNGNETQGVNESEMLPKVATPTRRRRSTGGRSIASSLYTSGGSLASFHTATGGDDSAAEDMQQRGRVEGAWASHGFLSVPHHQSQGLGSSPSRSIDGRERTASVDTIHSAVSALRKFPTPPGRSRETSSSDGTLLARAQLDVADARPRSQQRAKVPTADEERRKQLRAFVSDQLAASEEASRLEEKKREVNAARSVSGVGLRVDEWGAGGRRESVESRRASIGVFEEGQLDGGEGELAA